MKPEPDFQLADCLDFIREADALKTVERKTRPMSADRRENSAEHSWHLALMAMVLAGTANREIDLFKVLKMLVIHDLPEIYASDVFIYDRTGDHALQERAAAERLFALLPESLRGEFHALWEEFEEGKTEEAKFARALDRFQPCFCNFNNEGGTWQEFGIAPEAVLKRNRPVGHGSEILWQYLQQMVETAKERGYFPDEKDVKYG